MYIFGDIYIYVYVCVLYTYICVSYIHTYIYIYIYTHTPGASVGKEPACNAGDMSLIPGSERSPGEENDTPLQYSCLGISMNRGAWWVQFTELQT